MEQSMNIFQKLFYIQQNTIAPKDKNNDFGGFRYRNVEAILAKNKALFKRTGTIVLFNDKIVEVNGNAYVEATATLFDVTTGESLSATANAREMESKKGMDASQCTGCASTYARKYALCALLCIDDATTKPVSDPDAYDPKINEKDKEQTERKRVLDAIFTLDITRKELDEKISQKYPGMDADTIPVIKLEKYYMNLKGRK